MSQDNISINPATTAGGPSVAADQLADGSVAQQVKILDGTPGSANPLKITSGGHALILQPDTSFSGTLAQATDTVVQSSLNNYNTLTFFVGGTWDGEIHVAGSIDGTNYVDLMVTDVGLSQENWGGPARTPIQYNSTFKASVSGYAFVKFYYQAYTSGSTSIVASLTAASASSLDGVITMTDPNNDFVTNVHVTAPVDIGTMPNVTMNDGATVYIGNSITLGASSNVIGVVGLNAGSFHIGSVSLDAGTYQIGNVGLLSGSNIIGSLTANQSVNQTQIGGVSVATGNGTSASGVQRVTLASDSTGQVMLATGANVIGSLAANQSVNLSQVGGTSVAAGNGVSTGALRVTLSSDSTGQVKLAAGANAIGSVTVTGTPAVSISGTPAVTISGTPAVTVSNIGGILNTGGDLAPGSSDSASYWPMKIGGTTAVAAAATTTGKRTSAWFDTMGRVVTTPFARQATAYASVRIQSTTAQQQLIAAGAAGVFNDITHLSITNSSATATMVYLYDGASAVAGQWNIPGGGGITIPYTPQLPQAVAATAWNIATAASVDSVWVNVVYAVSK